MDSLPPEIKLQVLEVLDFPTLKALVRASPIYHAVYLSHRSQLLTPLTLQQLYKNTFSLDPPSQSSTIDQWTDKPYKRYVHVCVNDEFSNLKLLTDAFQNYHDEIDLKFPLLKLSAETCTTLLAVDDLLTYGCGDGAPRVPWETLPGDEGRCYRPRGDLMFPLSGACLKKPGNRHCFLSWS